MLQTLGHRVCVLVAFPTRRGGRWWREEGLSRAQSGRGQGWASPSPKSCETDPGHRGEQHVPFRSGPPRGPYVPGILTSPEGGLPSISLFLPRAVLLLSRPRTEATTRAPSCRVALGREGGQGPTGLHPALLRTASASVLAPSSKPPTCVCLAGILSLIFPNLFLSILRDQEGAILRFNFALSSWTFLLNTHKWGQISVP